MNNKNTKTLVTSPTYSNTDKLFTSFLKPLKGTGVLKDFSLSKKSCEFINGSLVEFAGIYAAQNLRGKSVHYIFADEAALYPDNVFNEVLRPMAQVNGRKIFLFSTPFGQSSYFYDLYVMGQNSDKNRYYSIRRDYTSNPLADILEINDARENIPDVIFRQEYLAEFMADGGSVFNLKNINVFNEWKKDNSNGEVLVAGLDIGRKDYTVLTIMNLKGEIYFIYRTNNKKWPDLINELYDVLIKYKVRTLLIETNNQGDVIYDLLEEKCKNKVKLERWWTSNSSKSELVEGLQIDFVKEKLSLPSKELFNQLHIELNCFSFEFKNNTIVYNGRSGVNDDCVMSLMLSNRCRKMFKNTGNYDSWMRGIISI